MSETRRLERARWVASVASTRGVRLEADRIEHILALVVPTLDAFAAIADELAADDDMYEFRRLLADKAAHG